MTNPLQNTKAASAHAASPLPAAASPGHAATGRVRLADEDADYARLGINRNAIAPWEDGQRESTESGHFEWWYFDAHLDDGATVVVAFYTKPTTEPNAGLTPMVTINLTLPDGRIIDKTCKAKPEDFSASKTGCDVKIGSNRIVGDLHRYRVTANIEDVWVDVDLVGQVPAWRPKAGHTYYSLPGQPDRVFAWLPSVPQGQVTIDYTVGGVAMKGTGIGYHDHNWGDAPMQSLMHDWYWSRAKVGPYSTINAYITTDEEFGYSKQATFLLAKDGEIVAQDGAKVVFSAERISTDEQTGKPVADVTSYTYAEGDLRYVVTYTRERTILRQLFTDALPPAQRAAAIAAGVDSAYLRFTGEVSVEKYQGDKLLERFSDPGIWELMYFGHARTPMS